VAFGGEYTLAGFGPSDVQAAHPLLMLRIELIGPQRSSHALVPTLKPLSHALRPVTTGNALSAMYYRNCWHIFGPRLSDRNGSSFHSAGGGYLMAAHTRMLV